MHMGWPQSMVLRLASTAVQNQSPQLQPKQPFLSLMSFWSFCSVTDCHRCFNLKTFWGRVLCQLFCQMHCSILVAMFDGDISQWCVTGWLGCDGWIGWINLYFFCASSGIWSLLWQDMFLHSQGLVFSSSREGGQQRLFLAWSNSPVSLWYICMETCCFMLFLFLYVIQVVDWGLRLSLLLSLSDCFYDTFIFILVLFLSRALAWLTWHFGWGRVLNHWTTRKECFMASKTVASRVKSCSGWSWFGKDPSGIAIFLEESYC